MLGVARRCIKAPPRNCGEPAGNQHITPILSAGPLGRPLPERPSSHSSAHRWQGLVGTDQSGAPALVVIVANHERGRHPHLAGWVSAPVFVRRDLFALHEEAVGARTAPSPIVTP